VSEGNWCFPLLVSTKGAGRLNAPDPISDQKPKSGLKVWVLDNRGALIQPGSYNEREGERVSSLRACAWAFERVRARAWRGRKLRSNVARDSGSERQNASTLFPLTTDPCVGRFEKAPSPSKVRILTARHLFWLETAL
jgi:hypothetical protein